MPAVQLPWIQSRSSGGNACIGGSQNRGLPLQKRETAHREPVNHYIPSRSMLSQGHLENHFGSPFCLRWRQEAGNWLVLFFGTGEESPRCDQHGAGFFDFSGGMAWCPTSVSAVAAGQ